MKSLKIEIALLAIILTMVFGLTSCSSDFEPYGNVYRYEMQVKTITVDSRAGVNPNQIQQAYVEALNEQLGYKSLDTNHFYLENLEVNDDAVKNACAKAEVKLASMEIGGKYEFIIQRGEGNVIYRYQLGI